MGLPEETLISSTLTSDLYNTLSLLTERSGERIERGLAASGEVGDH